MSQEIAFLSLDGDPLAIPGRPHPTRQNLYVNELSRYLGGIGLQIDVYSRRKSGQQPNHEEYSRGARIVRIPIGPPGEIHGEELVPYLKDIADWFTPFQIKQGLQYKLVHSHSYLSGPVGIHFKNTWGIPFLHTFHSLGLVEKEIFGPEDQPPEIRLKIEKLICRNADRIIVANTQEKMDLEELYQVNPEIISVIPSGVNLKTFRPLAQDESRKEIAFPNDVFLITYVGRLDQRKGLDVLLKAMQLADNPVIQAVIVGGPPSEKPFLSRADLSREPFQKYITMVDDYGLEKQVTFTGGKPQDQLAPYYCAGDVTVVPSLYEPFSIPALEGLACGSSVIASRVSGLKNTVQENQVGTLFEPGSAEQLAEKIKIFYDQPQLNKELRENARPYVEENSNWMYVANHVRELYQELIKKAGSL